MDDQILFLAAFCMGWVCKIIFDFLNQNNKDE